MTGGLALPIVAAPAPSRVEAMIETDVRPPLERAAHMVRPRLIAEMQQEAQDQVVLVTGLAGVGKTTLVRQWVSWLSNLDTSAGVAGMTVDARDNDLDGVILEQPGREPS